MRHSIIEKLKTVEKELSQTRGKLRLFGIFYREESNKWPLVVSADWFGPSQLENTKIINDTLRRHLSIDEIVELGWTYAISPSDPAVHELNRDIEVEHGEVVRQNFPFRGADIASAVIITSQSKLPVLSAA